MSKHIKITDRDAESPAWSSDIVKKLRGISKEDLPDGETFLYVESSHKGDYIRGLRVAGYGNSENLGNILGVALSELPSEQSALVLKGLLDAVSKDTLREAAKIFFD